MGLQLCGSISCGALLTSLLLCTVGHEKTDFYRFDCLFPSTLFSDVLTCSMQLWATITLLKKEQESTPIIATDDQIIVKKLDFIQESIGSLSKASYMNYEKFEYLFTVLDAMKNECDEGTQAYSVKILILSIMNTLSEVMDAPVHVVDVRYWIRSSFVLV